MMAPDRAALKTGQHQRSGHKVEPAREQTEYLKMVPVRSVDSVVIQSRNRRGPLSACGFVYYFEFKASFVWINFIKGNYISQFEPNIISIRRELELFYSDNLLCYFYSKWKKRSGWIFRSRSQLPPGVQIATAAASAVPGPEKVMLRNQCRFA